MESKYKATPEEKHNDGLMMVGVYTRQAPADERGKALEGEEAAKFIAGILKNIIINNGVSVAEARESLQEQKEQNGPYLGGVLRALEILEEEEKKR